MHQRFEWRIQGWRDLDIQARAADRIAVED